MPVAAEEFENQMVVQSAAIVFTLSTGLELAAACTATETKICLGMDSSTDLFALALSSMHTEMYPTGHMSAVQPLHAEECGSRNVERLASQIQ